MRKLGENIVDDPARRKARMTNAPDEQGLGSLGSWVKWLRNKNTLRARFKKRVDTEYRRK